MVTIKMMTVTKILSSVFAIYSQVLLLANFHYHLLTEKKLSVMTILNIFVSGHLNQEKYLFSEVVSVDMTKDPHR